MSHRQKNKAAKADRASFFLAKSATPHAREGRSPDADGGAARSEEDPPLSPLSSDTGPEDSPPTTQQLKKMLSELTDTIQKNMATQIQTLTADLRKEIIEVSQRTAQIEKRMDDFAEAHNGLADKLHELDTVLHDHAVKMADMEDRSRRNNLRIRGIPESVLNPALPDYLLDLFQALSPETHPDQLIIDRAHRLRRPKHLPNSTARDVIVRVHFYHAKERLVRASRTPGMPDPYKDLKIFTDLSAATLQFRKSLTPLTTTLREKGIMYRWGYPAKLLIQYQDSLHAVSSLPAGKEKFKMWGLPVASTDDHNKAKIPRMTPEWTPA
ncbi:Hypothetical predicted protein [Pelobates cultripes]|uniref:Uncharacterized protein n=2 Tax=Pelobates cultripes TaxID=61616 RepID=A0AAD1W9E4_PELCU|nr:Hypothetical predicted protein [Pelobates cultripes]